MNKFKNQKDNLKLIYRKARTNDIESIERCRVQSINNCKTYSKNQLEIWKNSNPNWESLIQNTIVCINSDIVVGFVVSKLNILDYLYVCPNYQNRGIGNYLVALVEKNNMKCDCNPYSEKILIKRNWSFFSNNLKIHSDEKFENKWYIFKKNKNTKDG